VCASFENKLPQDRGVLLVLQAALTMQPGVVKVRK
jgi:hypothetical protein